jgi:O-acetylserine/cysteine efflux transporter
VKLRHVALAVLVAVIWGIAFVMTRLALDAFSPPRLTALRFAIAAVPALFVPRPHVSWGRLVAAGLALFTGQFLFQFFGIALGMPPGLAAVVVQTQAFFTILFAAPALLERPTGRQLTGMGLALAGVLAIATTLGDDLTATGLALTVLSAVSWGIGNVLVKRLGQVEVFRLVVWLSLVPVLPSLALSAWVDGAAALVPMESEATWIGLGAASISASWRPSSRTRSGVICSAAIRRRWSPRSPSWRRSSRPLDRRWCSASGSGRLA